MRRITRADIAKKCARFCQLDLFDLDQPQIRLVHERRGLQRMARTFTGHVSPREPTQLVVDQRHELIERSRFPAAPGHQ